MQHLGLVSVVLGTYCVYPLSYSYLAVNCHLTPNEKTTNRKNRSKQTVNPAVTKHPPSIKVKLNFRSR
ncbi:hypothetical protein EYB25_003174 [Talaromyces marneffei]|nr:hypothetical protein EYB25_003174 [Talaromyces marneffei]